MNSAVTRSGDGWGGLVTKCQFIIDIRRQNGCTGPNRVGSLSFLVVH